MIELMGETAVSAIGMIVGAGFSRHISLAMPTMSELAAAISGAPGIDASTLSAFGDDLEQWMSFLSVDQPWLTAAQNIENRATFLRVTELVQAQISAAENAAVASACPEWLRRLSWTLADYKASIFTFNYDTLLERALGQLQRSVWADLYAAPLTRRNAGVGLTIGADGPRGPIPVLYKLHGSVNWAFGGLEAPPSDPIVLKSDGDPWSPAAQSGRSVPPRETHLYDDLQPLVVPPTFSKGPYFANRALQAQWRSSAASLAECRLLIVVGYSFPVGDLVARQWLATSFKGDTVVVVNPDHDVATRVQNLLPETVKVEHLESIGEFVDWISGPIVHWRVAIPENDNLGLQVELEVGGEDLLSSVDRTQPPWNPFDETAQGWVHQLLDKFLPGAREKGLEAEPWMGSVRESKWAVMPKNWAFDRAGVGAAIAEGRCGK